MNLRSLISPRKARKTRKKQDVVLAYQCRSGFVAPTETFQGINRLRNVSDGVANPVTLSEFKILNGSTKSTKDTKSYSNYSAYLALVPKLLLGNPVSEAPASRVGKLELPRLRSQAGAWERANPVTLSEFNILNGSTKDTKSYIVEFFVLFVSFVDKKL